MRASLMSALTAFCILISVTSLQAQRKRTGITKPSPTNKTTTKITEPSLPELLKSLKEFLLLSAHYKDGQTSYRVSTIDFDDCKFLFETSYDSVTYDGSPYRSVSRFTSDFRYFTEPIAVYKEGLGKPTLVTFKTAEDRKLVLQERNSLSGSYRRDTTETMAFVQLAFEEKDSGQKAASMLTQIIKLCKAR